MNDSVTPHTETAGLIVNGHPPGKRKPPGSIVIKILSIFVLLMTFIGGFVVLRWTRRHNQHSSTRSNSSAQLGSCSIDAGINMTGVPDRLNAIPNCRHVEPGCETTVLIIRHCEKEGPLVFDDDGNQHCSYVGFERSRYLATLFGSRWPVPSQLYALSPKRHNHENYREVETLVPLAKKTGLKIHSNYTEKHHPEALADELFAQLRSGDLCGKLIVVSWKHSLIAELARVLQWNTAPKKYPNSFDEVWQLKYVYSPQNLYHGADDFFADDAALKKSPFKKKKKTKTKKGKKTRGWAVYGSVTHQNFDPLEFSFKSGDYPKGGKKSGGKYN